MGTHYGACIHDNLYPCDYGCNNKNCRYYSEDPEPKYKSIKFTVEVNEDELIETLTINDDEYIRRWKSIEPGKTKETKDATFEEQLKASGDFSENAIDKIDEVVYLSGFDDEMDDLFYYMINEEDLS